MCDYQGVQLCESGVLNVVCVYVVLHGHGGCYTHCYRLAHVTNCLHLWPRQVNDADEQS